MSSRPYGPPDTMKNVAAASVSTVSLPRAAIRAVRVCRGCSRTKGAGANPRVSLVIVRHRFLVESRFAVYTHDVLTMQELQAGELNIFPTAACSYAAVACANAIQKNRSGIRCAKQSI